MLLYLFFPFCHSETVLLLLLTMNLYCDPIVVILHGFDGLT